MRFEKLPCLRIDCAEWYERPDFRRWLADGFENGGTATWWRPGQPPHAHADVFMTFDSGGGSDSDVMPEAVWAEISRLAAEAGMTSGVVWLSNVG
jgi:hypothetical protein